MKLLKPLALGGALALAASIGASQLRRTTLHDARLTSVTPGEPPIAHVALDYGPGPRPQAVIVDVFCAEGTGSATIDGIGRFFEIPLISSDDTRRQIQVTILDRRLSQVQERIHSFHVAS